MQSFQWPVAKGYASWVFCSACLCRWSPLYKCSSRECTWENARKTRPLQKYQYDTVQWNWAEFTGLPKFHIALCQAANSAEHCKFHALLQKTHSPICDGHLFEINKRWAVRFRLCWCWIWIYFLVFSSIQALFNWTSFESSWKFIPQISSLRHLNVLYAGHKIFFQWTMMYCFAQCKGTKTPNAKAPAQWPSCNVRHLKLGPDSSVVPFGVFPAFPCRWASTFTWWSAQNALHIEWHLTWCCPVYWGQFQRATFGHGHLHITRCWGKRWEKSSNITGFPCSNFKEVSLKMELQ